MRAFLIIISMCTLWAFEAQAQRYLPHQKGIQLTYGTVDDKALNDNFHWGLKYSVFAKNKNRWVIGGEYLQKQYRYEEAIIPKKQYTLEGGYYLNFLQAFRQTLFVSVGASGIAGYETSNKGEKLLYNGATLKHNDGVIYGGALSLEAEIFISNQLALLLNIRERVLGGAVTEHFHAQVGLGVKFILN